MSLVNLLTSNMVIKEIEETSTEEDLVAVMVGNPTRGIVNTKKIDGTPISQPVVTLQDRVTSAEVHLLESQVIDLEATIIAIEAILNKDHHKAMEATSTVDPPITETVHLASPTKTIEVATSIVVPEMTTTTSRNIPLATRCRVTLARCVIEIKIHRTRQIITEINSNTATREEEGQVTNSSTDPPHQENEMANSTVTILADLALEAVTDSP